MLAAVLLAVLAVARSNSFVKHFSSDKEKKRESCPRNKGLNRVENRGELSYEKPANKRHYALENSERARYGEHLFNFHFRLVEAVGEDNNA